MEYETRKPDFLIIGAQKAATTWLWNILDSHPDTDLPQGLAARSPGPENGTARHVRFARDLGDAFGSIG